MPIDPTQVTDMNQRRYGLPVDSCVGDAGPTPEQAAVISTSGAKATNAPNLAPTGGSVTAGGSRGKAVGQTNQTPPIGYDGP